MKTLISLCVALTLSSAAFADTWMEPAVRTYTSVRGTWRLTVFPRELGSNLGYFEDKVAGKDSAGQRPGGSRRCEATLEKLIGNSYIEQWRATLVNDVSPVSALVSEADGSFVTFDNWHSMGWGDHAIVIYSGRGELRRKLALTDIMSGEEFKALPRSVSSIRWGGEHRLYYDERTILLAVAKRRDAAGAAQEYRTLALNLADGKLVPVPKDE
jgi:hypothetical protein